MGLTKFYTAIVFFLVGSLYIEEVAAVTDDDIDDLQIQIYVISGVLGGVCLILTILFIVALVTIVKVKDQVRYIENSSRSYNKADNLTYIDDNRSEKNLSRSAPSQRNEYDDRYSTRGGDMSDSGLRDNYRMNRMNSRVSSRGERRGGPEVHNGYPRENRGKYYY